MGSISITGLDSGVRQVSSIAIRLRRMEGLADTRDCLFSSFHSTRIVRVLRPDARCCATLSFELSNSDPEGDDVLLSK